MRRFKSFNSKNFIAVSTLVFLMLIGVVLFVFKSTNNSSNTHIAISSDQSQSSLEKVDPSQFIALEASDNFAVNTDEKEKIEHLQSQVEQIPNVNQIGLIISDQLPSSPLLSFQWEGEPQPYSTFNYKVEGNKLILSIFLNESQLKKYNWSKPKIARHIEYLTALGVFAAKQGDMSLAQKSATDFINDENKQPNTPLYIVN